MWHNVFLTCFVASLESVFLNFLEIPYNENVFCNEIKSSDLDTHSPIKIQIPQHSEPFKNTFYIIYTHIFTSFLYPLCGFNNKQTNYEIRNKRFNVLL